VTSSPFRRVPLPTARPVVRSIHSLIGLVKTVYKVGFSVES
jgi:hypothetical protein